MCAQEIEAPLVIDNGNSTTSVADARRRVLVVDDDATVADVLGRYLELAGFEAASVADGESALIQVETFAPDVIVLDVMLPGCNGFEVCQRLQPRAVPVIMLTARGEEGDRLMGLSLGADDYVVKPFSPRELVARIRAVLRRSTIVGRQQDARTRIGAGDFELDVDARSVWRDGQEVPLTPLEFGLLYFLVRNPRRAFRREELLEHVWGYTFGGTSTVTVHVQRLRAKIERDPERPAHIVTVWGEGYRFDP